MHQNEAKEEVKSDLKRHYSELKQNPETPYWRKIYGDFKGAEENEEQNLIGMKVTLQSNQNRFFVGR